MQAVAESASYNHWAVAAAPDYLWVGSFYEQAVVQQVDRTSLAAVANVTLPDSMFLDHIMLSNDHTLVYVNWSAPRHTHTHIHVHSAYAYT